VRPWLTSLALLVAACRLPSADVELATVSTSNGHERPPTPMPEPASELPTVGAGECPPALADVPSSYFDDRLLIRLPEPLDHTSLVETGPNHAQLIGPVQLPSCLRNYPAVPLERMIIELRDSNAGTPLERVRDEVLNDHGLRDGATLIEAEVDPAQREGEWVFELPTGRLLIAIRSHGGSLVVLIYEVDDEGWSLVVDSLRESYRRLVISWH
jgi:hypothetical protein